MVIMQNSSVEICRKLINIGRSEEYSCEWIDTHLVVRTDKGIHCYEFSHSLETYDKQLDFVETFLQTPTSSAARSIFDCKFVQYGLRNSDISEMILDPAMWAHSLQLTQEMTSVLEFKFSPTKLFGQKAFALAILTNIGNVEIFAIGRSEWKSVLNVSNLIKNQFQEILKNKPSNFSELRNTAYKLASSSFCWAPNLHNGSCYLATSQKTRDLYFWLISSQEDISGKFCGKMELAFEDIVHLKWIPKTENNFILLCSNVLGQVMVLECQIKNDNVTLVKSHMLWEHCDRMATKFSDYHISGNRILLFYNKHRHLVSQLLDESCRIISQSTININDYRITSIVRNISQYFVTTVNFKVYRIDYYIDSDVLKITLDLIEIKDINPTMELYSLKFSCNGVLSAGIAIDRKIIHKKDPAQLEVIFIQAAPDIEVMNKLLSNPTKLLTDYWDCIELLRFKIVKQKMLPAIDYKALLLEGETDVYKLKIYLIILRLYDCLVNNTKITNGLLPENSIPFVKEKILAVKANSNIKELHHKHITGKSLSTFEKETFVCSRSYLHNYCKNNKTTLAGMASADMMNLVKDNFKYTCQGCEDQIDNVSCKNGHINKFCSLTFIPIESLDYLSCKYCNTIARNELLPEIPLCVFCDSYMDNSYQVT